MFLFSPERKYSSEGNESPLVIKLEHLENQLDESHANRFQLNSNLFGNMSHFVSHFNPQVSYNYM